VLVTSLAHGTPIFMLFTNQTLLCSISSDRKVVSPWQHPDKNKATDGTRGLYCTMVTRGLAISVSVEEKHIACETAKN